MKVLLLLYFLTIIFNNSATVSAFEHESQSNSNCKKKTEKQCKQITNATCFGVKIPYEFTSNELVTYNYNFTEDQIIEQMSKWESLINIPKCWAVVQPLICSLFLPKCHEGYIDLPSQEICKRTRNPCRVILEASKEWPEFLRCENFLKFPTNCKNDLFDVRYNTTSVCMSPMIPIENNYNTYDGFEGCALRCQDPLFTDDDHTLVRTLILWFGSISAISLAVTIITFFIDWKSSCGYPSIIVFYINCTYLVATVGWLFQFFPNTKDDIICRKDLTIRRHDLSSGENIFCVLVFIFIYFGSMSALTWLVVFSYVWNLTCNAVGRIREKIEKQRVVYHVISWIIPIFLTIFPIFNKQIDGESLSGVCFLSNERGVRGLFLLTPVVLALLISSVFFGKGIIRLAKVSNSSSDFISARAKNEIKSNNIRVIIFTVSFAILVSIFVFFQIYQFNALDEWRESFREKTLCMLNFTDETECEIGEKKPDLKILIIPVVIFFIGGILVSTWAWTSASLRTWKRCCANKFRAKSEEVDAEINPHVQKHKLISKAFAKRHQLPGRLSLSFTHTNEDPIGLNKLLDPLKQESQPDVKESDLSSEWAAALPNLVNRRGAIIPPHSSNSCISDTSSLAAVRALNSEDVREYKRNKRERNRRDWFRMGRRKIWSRRGSSSSLESNTPQLLPSITALISKASRVEQGVQTSFEFANIVKMDKATQSSIPNVHEIGTQTKKSATKKRKTDNNTNTTTDNNNVLRLLTPN